MNNQNKRKIILGGLSAALLLTGGLFAAFAIKTKVSGSASAAETPLTFNPKQVMKDDEKYSIKNFDFSVDPATFQINLKAVDHQFDFSGTSAKAVDKVKKAKNQLSWEYPSENLRVKIEKQDDHLHVELTPTSKKVSEIDFPKIQGDTYYLPIGEGKRVPANDPNWQSYFKENSPLDLNESFSMSFLSAVQKNTAATIVMENNFHKQLIEDPATPDLDYQLKTTVNQFNREEPQKYDIYLSESDPVAAAKLYQKNRIEHHQFTSLAEKAKKAPEVKKLIGASHFYYWQNRILTMNDVKWQVLQQEDHQKLYQHIGDLLEKYSEDGRGEFDQAISALKKGEAYKYEKNTILNALNTVLAYSDFYDPSVFPDLAKADQDYLKDSKHDIPTEKRFSINKQLLKSVLKNSTKALDQWGQETSTNVIQDMKASGIKNAFIGLANWNQGLINPTFVQTAKKDGYLIGPYDSYQSIHETPSMDWNTAGFQNNQSVYTDKTIMKADGQSVSGFLGKGRKVNQTLIENEWKYRVKQIKSKTVPFNSWFIDTDGAGEIYDDFNPKHPTSMTDDSKARLQRADGMAKKGLVVGTESGNDYFNQGMVFAHGLETPVIAWSDPDMRQNKESPYYVGGYADLNDGIPERYGKQVPIKEEYKATTIDPVYNLPLYKLVYNQSVITSHHWEWDSYKILGEVQTRRLQDYLYNVPPLIHLDARTWEKKKSDLAANSKIWSAFNSSAIRQEMTGFTYLSADKLLQKTTYGKNLSVIVNFSDHVQKGDGQTLQPHTGLIIDHGKETVISDQVQDK